MFQIWEMYVLFFINKIKNVSVYLHITIINNKDMPLFKESHQHIKYEVISSHISITFFFKWLLLQ